MSVPYLKRIFPSFLCIHRYRRRDRECLTIGLGLDARSLMLRFRTQFGGGGRRRAAKCDQSLADAARQFLRKELLLLGIKLIHFCGRVVVCAKAFVGILSQSTSNLDMSMASIPFGRLGGGMPRRITK
eukprot:gene1724-biopygen6126